MKRIRGAVLTVSSFVLVLGCSSLLVGCGSPGRAGFSEGNGASHAIDGNGGEATGETSSGIGADRVVAKGFIGDDDVGSNADDDDSSASDDDDNSASDDDDSSASDDDDSSSSDPDAGECVCPEEPPPVGRCCPTGWTLMASTPDAASFDHNEDGLICGMTVSGEGNFPSGENRKDNTAPGTCALEPGYSQ